MRNAMTEIVCISLWVFPKIGRISNSRFPKIGRISYSRFPEIGRISNSRFPKIGCISYSRFPKIGSIPSHVFQKLGVFLTHVFQQSVRFSANNRFCRIGYYPNHYLFAIWKGVVIKVGQIIDLFNPNNNKYAPIGDLHVQWCLWLS